MTAIIIRRIIGGAVFAVGCLLVENEIGVKGSVGVFLVPVGIMIICGYTKGLLTLLTPSQELKAKQREDSTS